MKGDTQVIAGVTIFFLGVLLGSYVDGQAPSLSVADFMPALVTLFAAYTGVRYAFDLQNKEKNQEDIRKNLLALNSAVVSLSQMHNQLSSYKRQIIDTHRERADRSITMRPTVLESQNHLRIDSTSLSYILDSTKAQALPIAMNAESSFFRTIATINERSRIMLDEVHPCLNGAGVREGTAMRLQEVEEILTHGVFVKCGRITDSTIEMVEDSLPALKNAADELAAATKELYPDQSPRSFEAVDPTESGNATNPN